MSHSEASLALLWPGWFCLMLVVSVDDVLGCGGDSVQLHPGSSSGISP